MGKIPVALQLYTVREDTAKDFVGTVRKVAEMGYDGVEFAGYGGLSATEMKKLLNDLGVKAAGTHVGLEAIEADINAVADYNKEIGNEYIIVPSLAENRRGSKDAWLATADAMNKAGAELKKLGLQLGYHNHAFEFEKIDGQYAYDLFIGAMDPDLVKVELDLYWVTYAGEDALAYIKKYASRLSHTHMKEMTARPDKHDTEVGSGIYDWDAIFAAIKNSPVVWNVVEQENFDKVPPIEAVKISVDWLKQRQDA